MPDNQALAKSLAPPQLPAAFTPEQVELIKRTIAKGATNDELQLFLGLCRRTGLDPFARQIYAIKRWDSREKREVMQAQASIDGFRLIADRTGKYEGQVGPYWCGRAAVWKDVWIENEPPLAAKVGVLKSGCREPFWAVAKFSEYCQTDRDGNLVAMWRKMPANQLAKCSESLALRKAFPQELSGVYTGDELDHVDTEPPHTLPEEATDEAKSSARPEMPIRPWRSFKGMIEEFTKLRQRLQMYNTELYTETLREFGVEHSNQFSDTGKATAAYRKLLKHVLRYEAADASVGELDVTGAHEAPSNPETVA